MLVVQRNAFFVCIEGELDMNAVVVAANPVTLVPDTCRGATKVLIRVSPDMFQSTKSDRDLHAAFDSLVSCLHQGGASVVAITTAACKAQVESWLAGRGFTEQTCTVHGLSGTDFDNINEWPRDGVIFAKYAGKTVILKTDHERRGKLDDWIATTYNLTVLDKSKVLTIDGGDSLPVDDMHWPLGAGSVGFTISPKDDQQAWDTAVALIEGTITPSPILLGSRTEAVDPLDLRIALAVPKANYRWKRSTAGFRSPSLLDRIGINIGAYLDVLRQLMGYTNVNKLEWAHADMVVAVTGKSLNTSPRVLVAKPTDPLCPHRTDDAALAMNSILDEIETTLTSAGCIVRRNPAPVYPTGILPYNNVIVQTEPDVVWLPAFESQFPELKAVDEENYRIWHDEMGFGTVIQVPGCYPLVQSKGCIRCATLTLPPDI
jgi:hypothetical protein